MIELIKNDAVIQVYFSEIFVKFIHEDIFGKDLTWRNSTFTVDGFKEFLMSKEKDGSKRFLLKTLSRKPLFTVDAHNLLVRRFIDESIVAETLTSLEHYFDDAFLMEAKIRSKLRKKFGKDRIRRELHISEQAFDEIYDKIQKQENLDPITQILKLIKNPEDLTDRRIRKRWIGKLHQRGFELDDIYQSLTIANKNPYY